MRMSLLAAIVALGVCVSGEAAERPNILFVFADDWGRYTSALAKREPGGISDLVSTPNYDRVVSGGVDFANAFVNAPSCTPCRSSLLSGQHFWRTGRGAILRDAEWDSTIPSFPLILQDAGYFIGFSGKVWSPGSPPDAPYGGKKNAFVGSGKEYNNFSEYVSEREDQTAAKEELYAQVRGNMQQFLNARPKDQPFCYWVGATNTHRTWIQGSGKKLWGIDPDKLKGKLPPFLPDTEIIREDVADYLGEVQAFDAYLGVVLDELERTGEWKNTMIIVSGDHGMPGVPHGKCDLYDFGVGVSLAIRWDARVPGGRVVEDFVSLPDLCPTILQAAGIEPPAVMTGRGLLNVLTSDESGLVDESRDAVLTGRERHVDTARAGKLPYPMRAIRTADYLYIRNFEPGRWPMGDEVPVGGTADPKPSFEALATDTRAAFADMDASPTKAWIMTHRHEPGIERIYDLSFLPRPVEELYDLKTDPFQMTNVAGHDAYSETQQELRNRLMKTLEETGDPRVTGDGKTFERSPFTD